MAHSPDTLERIRAATDIVALIGRQVPLKRSGRNHMGRCPFHQERTPSFSVNGDKAMFYCFGCHRGGDVFTFVMQAQGLDFGAAVRHLAAQAGIVLGDVSPQQQALQARQAVVRRALDALQKTVAQALWAPEHGHARKYLAARGVPAAVARQWGLGYAAEPVAVAQAVLEQGVVAQDLAQAGVLADADGGGDGDRGHAHAADASDPSTDGARPRLLFAHRLTFPIHDLQGGLVGFGGRHLRGSGHGPKYINSRDSELFHKRAHLFGLNRAHPHIRHSRQVVLVEGFMDVLAAHASDVPQSVAALGTALTADHAALLARLADEVVVMLDGDAAGERAAKGAAGTLLAAGLRVKLAWLPAGEDPASLAQRHGPKALAQVLETAKPAVEALMERAFYKDAVTDIESRVLAAQSLMPLLDAMGQSLSRELYIERLAAHVGVDVAQLREHWVAPKTKGVGDNRVGGSKSHAPASAQAKQAHSPARARPPGQAQARAMPEAQTPGPPPRGDTQGIKPAAPEPLRPALRQEFEMVCELLLFPQLRPKLLDLQEYLAYPQTQALVEKLACATTPEQQTIAVLAHVDDGPWRLRLQRIIGQPAETLDGDDLRANRTFADILRRLKWRHVDAALRHVLRDLALADSRGEATDTLLRRKQELTATKRALARAGR